MRSLRYDPNNPNKECMLINFYVDNFYMGMNLIKSQEVVWLNNNLQGQKYEKIDLETLKQKINDRRINTIRHSSIS